MQNSKQVSFARQGRQAVEGHLYSLLMALKIPYLVNGQIKTKNFFGKLIEIMQEQIPVDIKDKIDLKIYIGPEVIRALLAKLHNDFYRQQVVVTEFHPQLGALVLLGSDLEIYFSVSDYCSPEIIRRISEAAVNFINSAEPDLSVIRVLPKPVVKLYTDVLNELNCIGGSTLDFLVFRIDQEFKLIEPAESEFNIVDDLLAGRYHFIMRESYELDAVLIKVLIPLLQIDCLELVNQAEVGKMLQELNNELRNEMYASRNLYATRLPQQLSIKFYANFQKLILSGYNGCINNRAYKAVDGSTLNLLISISEKINIADSYLRESKHIMNERLMALMPEFSEELAITKDRSITGIYDIKDYIMPIDRFFNEHTDNGVLYHGTDPYNVLSILKNSFVQSGRCGWAVYGSGVYVTEHRNHAAKYGFPLCMYVLEDSNIRAVDIKALRNDTSLYKDLQKEMSGGKFYDFNSFLKYKYGVDVIVDDHTVIQNLSMVRLEQDISAILKRAAQVFSIKTDPANNLESFKIFYKSHNLMRQFGVKIDPTCNPSKILERRCNASNFDNTLVWFKTMLADNNSTLHQNTAMPAKIVEILAENYAKRVFLG